MSALNFAPAVRSEAKARVAIIGPTGSGKTWTALEWATVLGDKVAVIDSENGSAALYSDQYTFDTARWFPPYDAGKLAAAIHEAAASYDVVVVDSLTHFWQGEGGVLDVVDRAAQRARGNQFAGWKDGSPVWRALLDSLIFAPCHVIVTMRSKMDYVQVQENGRTKVEKVGMAPVARNDVEYEFTLVADMDQQHRLTVTKSRCAPLADAVAPAHQAGKVAAVLKDWLASADPTAAPEPPSSPEDDKEARQIKRMWATLGDIKVKDKDDCRRFIALVRDVESSKDLTTAERSKVIDLALAVKEGRARLERDGDKYVLVYGDDDPGPAPDPEQGQLVP